jgi:S1-C subfamily serine protease
MRRLLPIIALCLWAAAARGQTVPTDSASSVADQMRAATVRVWVDLGSGMAGYGSGVVVAEEGRTLVITNHHVVDGGSEYKARSSVSERQWVVCRVLVTDEQMDLAALEPQDAIPGATHARVGLFHETRNYTSAGFADHGRYHVHALKPHRWTGLGDGPFSWVLFKGTICSGDSGGPIFDGTAAVVGVVWGNGEVVNVHGKQVRVATDDTHAVCGRPFRNIIAKALEVE